MNVKINELSDGYKGRITVLLMSVHQGVTNKGAPYLTLVFQDNTGSIDAKYWSVDEHTLHQFKPGMLVNVKGDVFFHQKQLQFRVNSIDPIEGDINIQEYVKEGPIKKEELVNRVKAHIEDIKNPNISRLIKELMQDYEKDFFEFPAAKRNHHDFFRGLATHVLGMLDLAQQVCSMYPILNKDLLIGGIILHDLGKILELSGAIVTEYTTQGKLLGHISIMQAILIEKANSLEIDGEEVMLLRHMILSHHGVYEYGSPVLPMIPEAEILYFIDNIDARMNTISKSLTKCTAGEFTSRIFALDNRSFYKSKL